MQLFKAQHVGDYGNPFGDTPATGEIRVFEREPGDRWWAVIEVLEAENKLTTVHTSSGHTTTPPDPEESLSEPPTKPKQQLAWASSPGSGLPAIPFHYNRREDLFDAALTSIFETSNNRVFSLAQVVVLTTEDEGTFATRIEIDEGGWTLQSLFCECGHLTYVHEFDSGDPSVGMGPFSICAAVDPSRATPEGDCPCDVWKPEEFSSFIPHGERES